jgi:uncharacterized damage-inducible protein DinB
MRRFKSTIIGVALGLVVAAPAAAQTGNAIRSELLMHFDVSVGKVIALAEAMPADKYQWAPGAGVMPVGQVYAHIANYNFSYPSSAMGIAAPQGIKLDTIEAMRDKAQLVSLLKRSAEYVKQSVSAMPAEQLDVETQLYGRDVPRWAVLVQLVAHMNEHLGQSIAYARANDVVPPWSR